MRHFSFLCATFFLFCGCANQTTTDAPISLSVDLNQAVEITSSPDFSIREINLDEKEGINTHYTMLCSAIPTDSTLLFCTDTKAYVLNNEGNLIRKMGDQGAAANEYLKIWSLFLKKDGHIVINDSNKLLEYTPKGEFVKKHDIATFAGYALPLVGDRFYAPKAEMNNSSLLVFNHDFELVREVDSLRLPILNGCVTPNDKDFLFFIHPLTINLLTADFNVKEKYTIDFGEYNPILAEKGEMLSEEQSMENFTKRASLGGAMRDTENTLYFDVMCNNSLFIIKYDKKVNKTTAYEVFEADSPFISNNNLFHDNRYSYIRSTEKGLMVGIVTIIK